MVRLPTPELVKEACEAFSKSNEADEKALSELFNLFPGNTDAGRVLLKVVAVNSIYSTSIFAVKKFAAQIHAKGHELDKGIQAGSTSAFDLLEYLQLDGHKLRSCYSFASKYLSWHSSEIYPIYDGNIDRYLSHLIRQEGLPFKGSDAWKYSYFRDLIVYMRERYGLQEFTFKQMDAFFFQEGEALKSGAMRTPKG